LRGPDCAASHREIYLLSTGHSGSRYQRAGEHDQRKPSQSTSSDCACSKMQTHVPGRGAVFAQAAGEKSFSVLVWTDSVSDGRPDVDQVARSEV